jgi:predicted dehydrogenase
MDKKIRIGVVGCGGIATSHHIPSLRKIDDVELVAVADIDKSRALLTASKFHVSRVYTDHAEMLKNEVLDVVDICTSIKTHAGIAADAMERGLHVLVEKPLAVSKSECNSLIGISRRMNVKLITLHTHGFVPSVRKAKALIDNGIIGSPILARFTAQYFSYPKDWWAWILWELGPHRVYNGMYYLGDVHEVKVNCINQNIPPDFEVILFCKKGIVLIHWILSGGTYSYEEILGTKGSISVTTYNKPILRKSFETNYGELKYHLNMLQNMARTGIAYLLRGKRLSPHYILLKESINCIKNDSSPPVDPERASRVVEVIEEIETQLNGQVSARLEFSHSG